METPFKTANPSQFKLRLIWGIETGHKLVAEFSDCNWLPRQGEIMILPIDEDSNHKTWHQFKVANIIYDFEHQVVRAACTALTPLPSKTQTKARSEASLILQKFEEMCERHEAFANKPKPSFEAIFDENELPESIDEELEMLKKEILGKSPTLNSAQQETLQESKEVEGSELRKNLEDM